jgi:hypothetical protein
MGSRAMKRSVTIALLSVAVVGLSLLAGCTTTTKGNPTMNHREAKAELNDLFAAAQDAVGGDWVNQDAGAESCTLPSGATGARYPLARMGPGVPEDQQDKIIDAVVRAWSDAKFTPTASKKPPINGFVVTEVGYPASGYGVDGLYMVFGIGVNSTDLAGQTRCVPGDAAKINSDAVQSK